MLNLQSLVTISQNSIKTSHPRLGQGSAVDEKLSLRNIARALTWIQLFLLSLLSAVWHYELPLATALLNGLPKVEGVSANWKSPLQKIRQECFRRILNKPAEDWIPMALELRDLNQSQSLLQIGRITDPSPRDSFELSDVLVARLIEKCPHYDEPRLAEVYKVFSRQPASTEAAVAAILQELDRSFDHIQDGAGCSGRFTLIRALLEHSQRLSHYQIVPDWIRQHRQELRPWAAWAILNASHTIPSLAAELFDVASRDLPPKAPPLLRFARLSFLFWAKFEGSKDLPWNWQRRRRHIEQGAALLRGMTIPQLCDLSIMDHEQTPLVAAFLEERLSQALPHAQTELEWQVGLRRLARLTQLRIDHDPNTNQVPLLAELSFQSNEDWLGHERPTSAVASRHDAFFEKFVAMLVEQNIRQDDSPERRWLFDPRIFKK